MKKTIFVLICAALMAAGCKKGAQDVNAGNSGMDTYDPNGPGDNGGTGADSETRRTEVATGQMRDLLLALTRVHFAFDSSDLTSDARDALAEAAQSLQELSDVELYVDGHTDEAGTTEYNMSLGERRSSAVVNYLSSLGVAKSRLHIVSFGEEKPLADGAGEMANAKNRRVDYRLLKGNVEFVLEEGTPVVGKETTDESPDA